MKKTLALGAALSVLAFTAPASAELKFKPGEDARFHWDNLDELKKVDLKGQTLTIFGPWRGEDEALVRSVLAYFTDATGVDVKYSSSENYEQQVVIDTQAGSPPNITVLPQPGPDRRPRLEGLADAARRRDRSLGRTTITPPASPGSTSAPTRTRTATKAFYAFPYKIDVKSLVWYSPENFEDAGYEVPETHGGAEGARPTRSSPTAARRGASVSARAAPPAGRRPTGSKT